MSCGLGNETICGANAYCTNASVCTCEDGWGTGDLVPDAKFGSPCTIRLVVLSRLYLVGVILITMAFLRSMREYVKRVQILGLLCQVILILAFLRRTIDPSAAYGKDILFTLLLAWGVSLDLFASAFVFERFLKSAVGSQMRKILQRNDLPSLPQKSFRFLLATAASGSLLVHFPVISVFAPEIAEAVATATLCSLSVFIVLFMGQAMIVIRVWLAQIAHLIEVEAKFDHAQTLVLLGKAHRLMRVYLVMITLVSVFAAVLVILPLAIPWLLHSAFSYTLAIFLIDVGVTAMIQIKMFRKRENKVRPNQQTGTK